MSETPERDRVAPTDELTQVLLDAGKQYERYVELTRVAGLAALVRDEMRSYNRTWKHPLGLVMNASVEPTSR